MTIKYPPFLEVFNSKFDKNLSLAEYSLTNQKNIDKKALNNYLNNNIFNTNNAEIANFKISRLGNSRYDIQFSR